VSVCGLLPSIDAWLLRLIEQTESVDLRCLSPRLRCLYLHCLTPPQMATYCGQEGTVRSVSRAGDVVVR
jgi:hypothetical protein